MFGGRCPGADNEGTITLTPRNNAKHDAVVVLMHGLGDTSNGWGDVAQMWHAQLPYAKFILPTAPTQPVTMNMGMPMPSWYDITGLDERANEECQGIEQSRSRIQGILEKEHKDSGIPYNRMVLSGFSQGGAMSLYTGLQLNPDQQLAGVVVMSGYLAGAKRFALSEAGKKTPVFHGHGTADPMVSYAVAEKSQQRIKELGIQEYTLKGYRGMPHSVVPEELSDALQFLMRIIPKI